MAKDKLQTKASTLLSSTKSCILNGELRRMFKTLMEKLGGNSYFQSLVGAEACFPIFEALSLKYCQLMILDLGIKELICRGAETSELIYYGKVIPNEQTLFVHILHVLEAGKWLKIGNSGKWECGSSSISSSVYLYPQIVSEITQLVQEIETKYREHEVLLALVKRFGSKLGRIMRGEEEPLELLFPPNLEEISATDLYFKSPDSIAIQLAVTEVFRNLRLEDDTTLYILEIGAGTGSLTESILEVLADCKITFHYTFTDISPHFCRKAKIKFAKFGDIFEFCALDIEKDPEPQGVKLGSADIVIAGNVLHATSNIATTTTHVRSILKDHGILLLGEIIKPSLALDLTFGTTAGWWSFKGKDPQRKNYPLLTGKGWMELLEDSGFLECNYLDLFQSLIVGEASPTWPSKNVILDAPITKNGGRIEEPVPHDGNSDKSLKKVLKNILEETMGMPLIGSDELSFFELGVDSLLAIEYRAGIQEALKIKLPPKVVLEYPSLEALSEYISSFTPKPQIISAPTAPPVGNESPRPSPIIPIRTTGTEKPMWFFPNAYGLGYCYTVLAKYLPPNVPLYALNNPQFNNPEGTFKSIPDYARAMIPLIQGVQPRGPYRFCGFCFAGSIAMATATLLIQMGQEVESLTLLDTLHPQLYVDWIVALNAALTKNMMKGQLRELLSSFGTSVVFEALNSEFLASIFVPPPYSGHVNFVKARAPQEKLGEGPECQILQGQLQKFQTTPLLGWESTLRSMSLYSVDAEHFSMLEEEKGINEVAKILNRVLQERGMESSMKLKRHQFGLNYQLIFAAKNNDIFLVENLLSILKLDPNYADPESGETAIHWAIKNGNVDMAQVLLQAGAIKP